MVTGSGGSTVRNPEQQDDLISWQDFTTKFISRVHSLTVAETDGSALLGRKLSLGGIELDRFLLNK
jgi:acid phosphatase type 7